MSFENEAIALDAQNILKGKPGSETGRISILTIAIGIAKICLKVENGEYQEAWSVSTYENGTNQKGEVIISLPVVPSSNS